MSRDMEKKKNFVQIPIWLLDELTTVKEIKAFCKMYNGWCLLKDADGWYYRSKSKLKEDFGMNPKCSDTRVTNITKKFEELGILYIKSEGKKTNWFKFDEAVLFNHIEDEDRNKLYLSTKEQVVPKGKEQVVPKQEVNDRNKLYLLYNTRENNNKENNMGPINEMVLGTEDNSNEPIIKLNTQVDLPIIEYCGLRYNFNKDPLGYMMVLGQTKYGGRRPIDDWYKNDIDTLRYAISQVDNKDWREHFSRELSKMISA